MTFLFSCWSALNKHCCVVNLFFYKFYQWCCQNNTVRYQFHFLSNHFVILQFLSRSYILSWYFQYTNNLRTMFQADMKRFHFSPIITSLSCCFTLFTMPQVWYRSYHKVNENSPDLRQTGDNLRFCYPNFVSILRILKVFSRWYWIQKIRILLETITNYARYARANKTSRIGFSINIKMNAAVLVFM